jgi:HlyD family secretion protein
LRQAEAELERANVNVFQDDVKREQYEQALADLRDARVALKDVEALQASRRQQSASVRQTQISLNDRRRELNETEIRAPISGIVTQRLVQEGELVANLSSFSAGTPLYRIDDRSQMIVELGVNEIDVAKLEVGMGAEIEVDAFPNETFPGTVRKIAPVNTSAGANPGAQDPVVRYEVEIALDESDDRLKGGMSATCTMTVVDLEDVLRIPGEYLGREGDITYVVLENGDRVDVVVGESSGAFVQIIDGVSEGTEIQRPEFTGPDRRGVMQFGPEEDEEPEAEEE